MRSGAARLGAIAMTTSLLTGCGTTVPSISEAWDGDAADATTKMEFEIKRRVFCDLKDAVEAADKIPLSEGPNGKEKPVKGGFLPPTWGAQISLSLEVDENSALNPLASYIQPLASMQSFSLGAGATLSSTASRIDKFDPYYTIAYLRAPKRPDSVCYDRNDPFVILKESIPRSSPFIVDDLGIKDWLVGAMFTDNFIPSVGSPAGSGAAAAKPSGGTSEQGAAGGGQQPDTVTIEIKFVIVSNGNLNPSWKLTRASANTGTTPLLGVGRTRTHDLIITIGPPKPATSDTHLASQIGQATGSANRILLAP